MLRSRLVPLRKSRVRGYFKGVSVPENAMVLEPQNLEEGRPAIIISRFTPVGLVEHNHVISAAKIGDTTYSIVAARPGQWYVYVVESFCLIYMNLATFSEGYATDVSVQPMSPYNFNALLTVFRRNSRSNPVVANTVISISNPAYDPDPEDVETNEQGVVKFGTCDYNVANVFVDDWLMGYFEGPVELDWRGYGWIQLQ
jgi:hypothetical protein